MLKTIYGTGSKVNEIAGSNKNWRTCSGNQQNFADGLTRLNSCMGLSRTLQGILRTYTMLLASLFVDAITWWLEQDSRYTPEEMALYCSRLAGSIFEEASTWQ